MTFVCLLSQDLGVQHRERNRCHLMLGVAVEIKRRAQVLAAGGDAEAAVEELWPVAFWPVPSRAAGAAGGLSACFEA